MPFVRRGVSSTPAPQPEAARSGQPEAAAPSLPRVGYVMSRFPHLPETFILREMIALQSSGWDVRLYPLLRQRGDVVHEQARQWSARAVFLSSPRRVVLGAAARVLARQPRQCLGILASVVRGCAAEPPVLLRSLALLPAALHLADRVRRDGVDHVHAHYATYPLLAAWVAHRLAGASYSVTVHAHDLFVSQAMLRTKLQAADPVIAISEFNREFLRVHVGPALLERTHVVHCGVDTGAYRPATRSTSRLELLSIGSLQPYKGHRHLVEACRLLVARGVDLRCRIVGGGLEQEDLQLRIDEAGLRGVVELVGPKTQDEVAVLLSEASCYVQPSVVAPDGQMEGIPVALMEALACELPVVATELSGVPELVRDGETGVLVPPADAQALAAAVQRLHDDPAGAAALGRAGRLLVEGEFELDANVRRLGAVLLPAAAAVAS